MTASTNSWQRRTLCILLATSPCVSARSLFGLRSALCINSDNRSCDGRAASASCLSSRADTRRVSLPRSCTSRLLLNLRCGGSDESSVHVDEDASESSDTLRENLTEPIIDVNLVTDQISDESLQAELTTDTDDTFTKEENASSDESSEVPKDSIDNSEALDEIAEPSGDNYSKIQEILQRQSDFQLKAATRRAEAKSFHDQGDLSDAAMAFGEAALLLEEALELASLEANNADQKEKEATIQEERATCRLHEALCLFKDGRPEKCVQVCSDVLGDGVVVVEVSPDTAHDEDDINNDTSKVDGEATCVEDKAEEKVEPSFKVVEGVSHATTSSISSQVRARAHLRRSKARLALGDLDGALEDAKKSAFMGDRNAVAFYGRLMREGMGAANNNDAINGNTLGGWGDSMGGMSSNSFLEGMLGGMGSSNPLMPSSSGAGAAGSSDFSSSLLSSLLSNGSSSNSPMGLLGELLSPPDTTSGKFRRRKSKKKKNGIDNLAKSVLSNLLKRMEDKEMQKTICKYLHSTNTNQIMAFASMAGIPLREESASRLVSIANGITPRGISKSISNIKRVSKAIKTMRKILKVIDKYKTVLVLAMLCFWIKSAIVEPYPVDKRRVKRMAKEAIVGVVTT